ncbi:hypothetical protein N0V93_009012 [Gnomoniopsis smithogilvyi]|uniref:BTB domain transcription factor n=1 Tax=Gnomoniopsis smithogilvyi TaxID=1191159 RepID=A0A9W8YLZ1_9PEZI|nr:hypothetical protein N0V93_009012 [Gnomoniopsis smithogilvyi]
MTQTRSGKASAGDKHKLDDTASTDSPPAKTQKKEEKNENENGDKKMKQTTLDDSLNGHSKEKEAPQKDDEDEKKAEKSQESQPKSESKDGESKDDDSKTEQSQPEPSSNEGETAVEPHGRNGSTSSSILEKGIVYFFFRGRVGIDNPERVSDIARSYMVLRPIAKDAKLGDGPIGDAGNSRLIAIPKKVLPQSGKDRWIAFVEKTNESFEKLKEEFLAANDYDTKTAGTRHSPAATPIGEGVYTITTTGRESHLAYMLTLPEKLGEVQTEIGLKEKGSWILSTRNPQFPAPAGTAPPEGPDFSKEILDEFRSLRWMGTIPKHLIPNAQFLLIGESSGLDKAMQPDEKEEKSGDKEQPIEELEKLEDEDTERMEHLGEDASEAIFADLDAHAKDYPKLQTTF